MEGVIIVNIQTLFELVFWLFIGELQTEANVKEEVCDSP